jgi:hypothetical protein
MSIKLSVKKYEDFLIADGVDDVDELLLNGSKSSEKNLFGDKNASLNCLLFLIIDDNCC